MQPCTSSLAQDIRDMAGKVYVPYNSADDYPRPALRPGGATSEVFRVVGKTTRTVQLVNTHYLLDISTTREWKDNATDGEPRKSFAVELYSAGCDDRLANRNVTAAEAKDREVDVNDLFATHQDSGDAFHSFLNVVFTARNVFTELVAAC